MTFGLDRERVAIRSMVGMSCSRAARATGSGTAKRYARRCVSTCRRSFRAPTSSMTARARSGCPCACSSIIAFDCCRPASRRGSARARRSPEMCSDRRNPASGPGQKGAGGRERGGTELMLEFKVDDVIDWLWEDLQLPNLQPRGGPVEESEWKREGLGSARRTLAPRPPPLPQGIGEAARARARFAGIHRRRSAFSAAHAPPAAGAARGRVFSPRRLRQHVRARSTTREDLFLLGGGRAAARIQGAGYRVRRTHHRRVGIQRGGFLQGHRQRRHRRLGRPAPKCARSCRRASTRRPAMSTSSTHRTATTQRTTERRRAQELESIAKVARYAGYVEISAGARSTQSETVRLFQAVADAGLPCGRYSITGPDDVVGRRAPFLYRRSAGGRAIRSDGSRSMKGDWRAHVPQLEESGPQTRTRLVAGHLRGGSRQLHDGNRRVRTAGTHAALVVRRALHLPAVAAAHGLFALVRGRVSRQSGSCVPRREQRPRGQCARDRPRARACGLLQEQYVVPPLSGTGQCPDHRARGQPRATDRARHRGPRVQGGGAGARCGAVPRAIHRPRSAAAPRTLPGVCAGRRAAAG